MKRPFEPLMEVLSAEAETFEKLVETAKVERSHLISGDVAALNGTLVEQRALLERLAETESLRTSALLEWRDIDPVGKAPPGPAPSLREVASLAPPDTAARLERLRGRLQSAGEELRRLARGNYFLALKGLDFVDSTVQIVAEHLTAQEKPTYSRPGGKTEKSRSTLLVDRTA